MDQVSAGRVPKAAPLPITPDVEAAARALVAGMGRDPNQLWPRAQTKTSMKRLPRWKWYIDPARKIIAAIDAARKT